MRSALSTPGSPRTSPRRTPPIEAGASLSVRPLAISAAARDALTRCEPVVAAGFRRGASLALPGTDEVVFLSGPGGGLFPAHVVVRMADLGRVLAAARAPGLALRLDVQGVRVFRPRLASDPVRMRSDRARANVAAAGAWLRGLPTALGLGVTAARLLAPAGRWRELMAALQRDVPSAESALRTLVGRGAGSTPAGDDVALGALAHGWATQGQDAPAVTAMRSLASELCTLTTALGASYLRAAARAEFGSHLIAWVRALPHASQLRTQGLATRLAQHGATSGFDTLAGFVAAAEAADAAKLSRM